MTLNSYYFHKKCKAPIWHGFQKNCITLDDKTTYKKNKINHKNKYAN